MQMSAPSDLRTQLQSLSIHKDQRPASSARPVGPENTRKIRLGWWIAGLVIIPVPVALYLSRGQIEKYTPISMSSAQEIKLVPVIARQANDLPPLLTATGKIVSDNQVKVATKVSGQIVALLFEQIGRAHV